MDEFLAGNKVVSFLVGSGGLTTILVAWMGWRSHKSDAKPIAIDKSEQPSTWTMQTLLGIGNDVEEVRRAVDANTKALSDLTLQVNHIAYIFERKS
jgi:hypothetical protein